MAGSNVVIKEGTILFREGDEANGMFLVRKGDLEVYLKRDDNLVVLAKIGPGGMIGEMAFFDQKPRSASVRAKTDCEITVISKDDFAKLMRQIPKWFVSIMSSLSTRLRETNARLQTIEEQQKGVKQRWQTLSQVLHVLNLLWHKDGIKEGKEIWLNKTTAEGEIATIFNISKKEVQSYLGALIKQKIIGSKADQYKNMTLTITNRAVIEKFSKFIDEFTKTFPDYSCLDPTTIQVLETMLKLSKESIYDSATISFTSIVDDGKARDFNTDKWHDTFPKLEKIRGPIKMSKMSTNDATFKADAKLLEEYISKQKILTTLANAGLDR